MSKTERTLFAGRYILEAPLGRGGMGRVFMAKDTRMDRYVALKFLLEEADASQESFKRFEREAKTLASIGSHPNIVTVYDMGVDEKNQPYIITECIQGVSLAEYISKKGHLDPVTTVRLLAPIARALAHAHARGVIHRDVKSTNIMVSDEDERPILIDFGIAHVFNQTRLTQHGSVGTPVYMSPEQLDNRSLVFSSDFYSLGVVLYECLTGSTPFGINSDANWGVLYEQIRTEIPMSVHVVDPSVPQALSDIIDQCLIKDSVKRNNYFDSGAALAEALEEAVAEEEGATVLWPTSSPAKPSEETRKTDRPMIRKMAFGALFLGLAAIAFYGIADVLKLGQSSGAVDPMTFMGAVEDSMEIDDQVVGDLKTDTLEVGIAGTGGADSPGNEDPSIPLNNGEDIDAPKDTLKPIIDSNNRDFIYDTAKRYSQDGSTDAEQAAARKLFVAAANLGHLEAQRMTGIMYYQGVGGSIQLDSAEMYLQSAADQGSIKATVALAELYRKTDDCDNAIPLYEEAVEDGDSAAAYVLGLLYLTGECVPEDRPAGLRLMKKASQRGDSRADRFLPENK